MRSTRWRGKWVLHLHYAALAASLTHTWMTSMMDYGRYFSPLTVTIGVSLLISLCFYQIKLNKIYRITHTRFASNLVSVADVFLRPVPYVLTVKPSEYYLEKMRPVEDTGFLTAREYLRWLRTNSRVNRYVIGMTCVSAAYIYIGKLPFKHLDAFPMLEPITIFFAAGLLVSCLNWFLLKYTKE